MILCTPVKANLLLADWESGAKNLQSLAERGFLSISSAAYAVTCLWF